MVQLLTCETADLILGVSLIQKETASSFGPIFVAIARMDVNDTGLC